MGKLPPLCQRPLRRCRTVSSLRWWDCNWLCEFTGRMPRTTTSQILRLRLRKASSMKLAYRFRWTAALVALAALGLSGCHLFGTRDDSPVRSHSERPVLVEPAPAVTVPYEDPAPILPPAPGPGRSASSPIPTGEPQRLPIVPPPAIPPAADEEPVPTANRSTIRPICFQFASSSCCPPVSSCCPTTCCDARSSSLLSKLTAPLYSAKWRMECMKSSMKHRLSSLNPFNKCRSCAPVSSCCTSSCDPCSSFVSDGYVMEGVVVGEYSPYSMQPQVYQSPPMQYSTPPVQQYQYSQQPMMTQPPCATCQNQAAQTWQQPRPAAAPTYQQPSYPPAYSQQPAHTHQQAPPQNWQPRPSYQQPQSVTPQPALPQPTPTPTPATTRLQPPPAPAAQVSYRQGASNLPGYSNAVPAVRQAVR